MSEQLSSVANLVNTNVPQPMQGFYITGGTLPGSALSYVTREADHQLYEGLCQGQFCYVLTSRQMGKSSLMIRTAARLREAGIGAAVLDLTAIGQNLTAEQWYDGLLNRLGLQLQLEDELEEFWLDRSRLGPLQRWMKAIREIILPRVPGRLVIFVDEIDTVRSLPFSTDEFFAGIREFYNGRTEDPELERLTFCLLGVAAPSDLIQDTRTTPFNIGRRIELHDFTAAEATPLVEGLWREGQQGTALLERVLYWTNGHPYLTQRLCQALAEFPGAQSVREVDRKCAELYFVEGAQTSDDNLLFVRERMLRSEVEISGLLTLYEQAYRKRKVANDETSPLATTLRLSGLTRVENGQLRVRNRIYERSFDREWIRENMPDAELRRQRAAYRKGLLRAGAIATAILVVITSLALIAWQQRNRAREQEQINHQQLYGAQMSLAGQAWESSNMDRLTELLNLHLPQPGRADLRGPEWYLLWNLGHNDLPVVQHEDMVRDIFFTRDGSKLISVSSDTVKITDIATGQEQAKFNGHKGKIQSANLSRNSNKLVTGGTDGLTKVSDVSTGKELISLSVGDKPVTYVDISPDGNTVATISIVQMERFGERTVKLWDVATGKEKLTLQGQSKIAGWLYFSPNGKQLVITSNDGSVRVCDAQSGETLLYPEKKQTDNPLIPIFAAFSPDGSKLITMVRNKTRYLDLATGKEIFSQEGMYLHGGLSPDAKQMVIATFDGAVKLLDASTGKEVRVFRGHNTFVNAAAFSPDGKKLVTGGGEYALKVWDVTTGAELATLKGHRSQIVNAVFSPDGKWLATGSADKTARLWAMSETLKPVTLPGFLAESATKFSPDGKTLFSIKPDLDRQTSEVNMWDTATGKQTGSFASKKIVFDLALTPDGRMLATGESNQELDGTVRFWDVATGKELRVLNAHPKDWVYKLKFFQQGQKMITVGNHNPIVKLWDLRSEKELFVLDSHKAIIEVLEVSPDEKTMITGGHDRLVKLWDLNTGQELHTFRGHEGNVFDAQYSPDGKILATVGEDRVVKLWDLATKKEIRVLKGHSAAINSVAFSPDGSRLVTGSADNTVKLWDAATGQELLSIGGYKHSAVVGFSPDGRWLATSSVADMVIKLWRIAPEAEVAAQLAKEGRPQNK